MSENVSDQVVVKSFNIFKIFPRPQAIYYKEILLSNATMDFFTVK